MHSSARAAPLILLGLLLTAAGVHAQDRWIFVPVYTTDDAGKVPIAALTAPWEHALSGSIANNDAATLAETKASEPIELSDAQLEQYSKDLDKALDQLAAAERKKASLLLRDINKLTGPQGDYLRRAPERAQMLFDTCVYTAHLLQREKQTDEAAQQMLSCLRSFSGLKTSSRAPGLQKLIEAAQAQLDREPHGELDVHSTQEGCVVRRNGLPQGRTPLSLERVPIGPSNVQVECAGAPARIHTVDVTAGRQTLNVDTRFDAALRTHQGLALQYTSASDREQYSQPAAAELGRTLRVAHVVLLAVAADSAGLIVTPQSAPSAPLPSVAFRGGRYDPTAFAQALRLLQASAPPQPALQAPTPTLQSPTRMEPEDGPDSFEPAAASEQPRAQAASSAAPFIAAGMAALGVVAYGTGWALYAVSQDYRLRERSQIDSQSERAFTGLRIISSTTTFVGAALLSTAQFVWVPRTRQIPTWTWVVGAAGASATIFGIILAAAGPDCGLLPFTPELPLNNTCTRRTADATFGLNLASTALPLLTVPLAYVLHSAPVEIQMTGSGIQLRAAF